MHSSLVQLVGRGLYQNMLFLRRNCILELECLHFNQKFPNKIYRYLPPSAHKPLIYLSYVTFYINLLVMCDPQFLPDWPPG